VKSCKRLAYQFHQRKRSKFNWHQGISLGLSLCHSPGKAHSLFFSYIHNVRILFMHAWGYTAGRPLYGLAQHLLRPKEVPLGYSFFLIPHKTHLITVGSTALVLHILILTKKSARICGTIFVRNCPGGGTLLLFVSLTEKFVSFCNMCQ